MMKKIVGVLMVLAVVTCFTLASFAADTVKGKVNALDKEAKKIQIEDKEYQLSEEAASIEIGIGDEVEAAVEGDTVQSIQKQ